MASTFGMFETAKSGLSVSMENLKITGHNISNANTVGYTRQRIIASAKETGYAYRLLHPTEDNTVGQGVEVLEVQQLRSGYLDQQYRNLNTSYSYGETRTQALTYLEGLFNGESSEDSGLTTSMEKYFEAMNEFSKDTSSKEYRTNVQQQAVGLTTNFKNVYQEMVSLWNDQNSNISTMAEKVNSIATKISVLNDAIASSERTGEKANDLNDERNLLLDELSGYVNITYENNATNKSMVDVKIGEAELVTGNTANKIEITQAESNATDINGLTKQIAVLNADIVTNGSDMTPTTGNVAKRDKLIDDLKQIADIKTSVNANNAALQDISYSGFSLVSGASSSALDSTFCNTNNLSLNGKEISIEEGTLTGGKLYASMEMISEGSASNSGIPYYINKINSLVRSIATDINAIHQTGYTYPDGANESVKGLNFFEVSTKTDGLGNTVDDYSTLNAGNFSISSKILSSVYNIAGSAEKVDISVADNETGNGEVASSMYKIATTNDYAGNLNSVVGHLAITLNTSQSVLDTKESLVNSVDTQRTSISGVSVDEETTNLIVFQQAYSACARTITTIDEMLDTLINNTGAR